MKMKKYLGLINLFVVGVFFSSCTKDITLDLPDPANEIVVEGSIDVSQPPMVLLTKNSAYFGGFSLNDISQYFVHDAEMYVWSGTDTTYLKEFCLSDPQLASFLGIDASDTSANIPEVCIYTIPDILTWFTTGTASFLGAENKTYGLHIEAEGKTLNSLTSIPALYPFDSLSWHPHPDPSYDSLASVNINLLVPNIQGRYSRTYTKRNDEPFYPIAGGSVFEYKVFFGKYVSLPLSRGQSSYADFNQDVFGMFWRGDTVQVRFAQIDKATYDFYNTYENDGGDTPFSSPVKIISNIDGGLGIWAGFASSYGSIYIPR